MIGSTVLLHKGQNSLASVASHGCRATVQPRVKVHAGAVRGLGKTNHRYHRVPFAPDDEVASLTI